MNIVGFNFTKISAERKRSLTGQVKINNNIRLDNLQEAKLGMGGSDRKALRLTFQFISEFAPKMALLEMHGDILMLMDNKEADDTLKGWEKNKQLPQPVAQRVMNHILDRCNIQALLLAKDLNLPSPVPLPKVGVQKPKVEQKSTKKSAKKSKKKKKKS